MQNNEISREDLHFTIVKDGKEVECDILYEVADQLNNKAYIAYTDYVKDEFGKNRIVLGELINGGDSYQVAPIKDQEIVKAMTDQLKTLF